MAKTTKVKEIKKNNTTMKSPSNRTVNVPNVKVPSNWMITSAHSIQSSVLDVNQILNDEQVVVVSGEHCVYKPGDWVRVNVDTFQKEMQKPKHDLGADKPKIIPPFINIGDTKYLYMTDRNITFGYTDKNGLL